MLNHDKGLQKRLLKYIIGLFNPKSFDEISNLSRCREKWFLGAKGPLPDYFDRPSGRPTWRLAVCKSYLEGICYFLGIQRNQTRKPVQIFQLICTKRILGFFPRLAGWPSPALSCCVSCIIALSNICGCIWGGAGSDGFPIHSLK